MEEEVKRQRMGGRKKGVPNKFTMEVKTMVLEALEMVGGAAYLASKAESHPQAFMALLGKILPTQITGENGGPVVVANLTDDQLANIAAGSGD